MNGSSISDSHFRIPRRIRWIVSSSLARNRERSDLLKGAGPPPISPDCRSISSSARVAIASPIASSVNSVPFGPSTEAPGAGSDRRAECRL